MIFILIQWIQLSASLVLNGFEVAFEVALAMIYGIVPLSEIYIASRSHFVIICRVVPLSETLFLN